MRRELIAQQLELALRESLASPRLRLLDIAGQRPAEDEKREPWIPIKYGPAAPDNWFGVVPAAVRFERSPGAGAESLALVVKVKSESGPLAYAHPLDHRAQTHSPRPTLLGLSLCRRK